MPVKEPDLWIESREHPKLMTAALVFQHCGRLKQSLVISTEIYHVLLLGSRLCSRWMVTSLICEFPKMGCTTTWAHHSILLVNQKSHHLPNLLQS